jgi:RNA polymerase sigma-70 factor (ECF subfamily)
VIDRCFQDHWVDVAAGDERSLLSRAIDGDVRAKNELFDRWLPVVLAWVKAIGGPRIDPEDVTHEVFIVVLTRLETLQSQAAFQAWLYGITRRIIAKHRRRVWIQRWVGAPDDELPDHGSDPHSRYQQSEVSRRVQEILEAMPAKQREVLVLCDFEERSNPEVAELLGVPLGTVASRLRLARARFQKEAYAVSLSASTEGA